MISYLSLVYALNRQNNFHELRLGLVILESYCIGIFNPSLKSNHSL